MNIAVAMLVTILSFGWVAEKRIDRHALNILVRRVEAIEARAEDPRVKESCRKCLYHLDALATRRGKVPEDDWITLDSKDEQRLILQAMGLAGIKEARQGFWKEAWNASKRWAWKKVKGFLWHSAPWGVLLTWFWFSRKRLWKACVQWDHATDKLPDEVRHAFKGKDLERVHAKIREGT